MTLVELLVVLAILALLTTVAVTSSDVVLSQGRHDATTRTLRAIEEAVLGPQSATAQSDEPAAGFLADLGRLPRLVDDPKDEGIGLEELWINRGGMASFGIYPTCDGEVAVGCGWRGPYLRLPVGRDNIRDGWGRPFELTVNADEEIVTIRSLGADGKNSSDDLVLDFSLRVDLRLGGHVRLVDSDGQPVTLESNSTFRVTLYAPNRNFVSGSRAWEKFEPPPLNSDGTEGATAVNYNITTEDSGITLGPRYLRAYQDSPVKRKSKVVRIQRGGVVDLEIRQP